MRIDYQTLVLELAGVPEAVRFAADAGFDGFWTAETQHNPFLPHVLAAEHSDRLELGTGIAVAFARSPMTVAHETWDLQAYSRGRFILGLGSQVKAHITNRFSMEWSKPAARMREFVLALHAIWDAWETGERLAFRGEFYTHTLMTPFFNPGPSPGGRPKVFVSAVGPLMTKVAGEVCDGMLAHAFTTEAYVRDVTIPVIEQSLHDAGRSRKDFQLALPVFVVTGGDEREMAASRASAKQQIAFYGSTPAYRAVLEHHGWGDLQDELNALSKRGEWAQMTGLVDDTVLAAFAVVGEPGEAGREIARRFGDVADRVSFYTQPQGHGPEVTAALISGVRGR